MLVRVSLFELLAWMLLFSLVHVLAWMSSVELLASELGFSMARMLVCCLFVETSAWALK
jgi:hypothetical protein